MVKDVPPRVSSHSCKVGAERVVLTNLTDSLNQLRLRGVVQNVGVINDHLKMTELAYVVALLRQCHEVALTHRVG